MSTEHALSAVKFGLTGGMGSGKSTVGQEFADYGATVIDADDVVRQLREPGEAGYLAMIDILGDEIVGADEQLDKDKISSIIFGDDSLRGAVERAIHPLVWESMTNQVRELKPHDIAVFEVPLLKPADTGNLDGLIAVNTSPDNAVRRLANRDYTPEQARKRIRTQLSNEERAEMADFIIDNDGNFSELLVATMSAWEWMQAKAANLARV